MAEEVTVNVPGQSKGSDKATTVLGTLEAAGIAAGDFLVHSGPDGVNWKAPTFWIGLLIAALRGVMGFYTNKGSNTQVVTKQSGPNSTVNVDTASP